MIENSSKINLEDLDPELVKYLEEAGGSKLVRYTTMVTATEEGQTVFPIELETYDSATDVVMVQSGRTMLFPEEDYTIADNSITLVEGVAVGRTIGIYVLKNVSEPDAEVTISGAQLSAGSVTMDKLGEDVTAELDDVKKSVSDGKTLVASAITAKGIETAADATFETMAANVESIVTLDSAPGLEAATWTPGTTDQVIAAGNYLTGDQTIKGDANLVAANIAKGKSLFGVTGTYDPVTSSSLKVTTKNSSGTFTVPGKIVMVYVYNGTSSSFDALDSPGQNMLWIPGIEVFGYISGVSYEFARTVTSNTTVVIDYGYRYEVTLTINSNFNAITVDLGSELTESQYYTRIYYI